MMQKKLHEIFTKLKNVYKRDLYVLNSRYVIAGPISLNESYGTVIAILTEGNKKEIEDCIQSDFFYIEDIDSFKKAISNEEAFLTMIKFPDDSVKAQVEEDVKKQLVKFDKVTDWDKITSNMNIGEIIFDDRLNYDLVYDDKYVLQIGKAALPLITKNNIESVTYNLDYMEDLGLLELYMKFNFSHFQLLSDYVAIPVDKK